MGADKASIEQLWLAQILEQECSSDHSSQRHGLTLATEHALATTPAAARGEIPGHHAESVDYFWLSHFVKMWKQCKLKP